MGDSETECSYSPTECGSPILYTGMVGAVGQQPSESSNVATNQAHISQQEPTQSFVESQFQFSDTQVFPSQTVGTLDALAGLDSMLDNPLPFSSKKIPTNNKPAAPKQLVRSYTQPAVKVRSLDLILAKIPTTNLDKYTLASKLDLQDMKLLINTCGETVSYKATKSTLCDRLMQLIECGTLDKVFRSVHAVGALSNKPPEATQARESQIETYAESQAVRTPAQRTLSLPLAPPHAQHAQHLLPVFSLQRATTTSTATAGATSSLVNPVAPSSSSSNSSTGANFDTIASGGGEAESTSTGAYSKAVVVAAGMRGDSSDWAQVTDAELLGALNGSCLTASGTAAAVTALHFGSDSKNKGRGDSGSGGGGGGGRGVYFAEQPSSAWQSCDTATQHLLEESDSSLQFRRMLQRFERSKAGKFSGVSLSRPQEAGPGAASGANTDDTSSTDTYPQDSFGDAAGSASEQVPRSGGNETPSLLESIRAKLKDLVVSAGTTSVMTSSSAPASMLSSPPTAPTAPAAASAASVNLTSPFLSSFDALKLVVFRGDKLGLSLVKKVGQSGVERIVIQSKNHASLDPRADRLLNVGDELVCIQGAAVQALGRGGSGGMGGYNKECDTSIYFNVVMECIKQAPRPLQLGFVPPGTQR